jgi:hypothetical protein
MQKAHIWENKEQWKKALSVLKTHKPEFCSSSVQ